MLSGNLRHKFRVPTRVTFKTKFFSLSKGSWKSFWANRQQTTELNYTHSKIVGQDAKIKDLEFKNKILTEKLKISEEKLNSDLHKKYFGPDVAPCYHGPQCMPIQHPHTYNPCCKHSHHGNPPQAQIAGDTLAQELTVLKLELHEIKSKLSILIASNEQPFVNHEDQISHQAGPQHSGTQDQLGPKAPHHEPTVSQAQKFASIQNQQNSDQSCQATSHHHGHVQDHPLPQPSQHQHPHGSNNVSSQSHKSVGREAGTMDLHRDQDISLSSIEEQVPEIQVVRSAPLN